MRDSLRIQIFEATISTSPVGMLGLIVSLRAQRHHALHRDHVFRADLFGALVHRGVHVLVEDDLRMASRSRRSMKITAP